MYVVFSTWMIQALDQVIHMIKMLPHGCENVYANHPSIYAIENN